MNTNKNLVSLLILILLGCIWGTGYSIARFAMINDVPPFGYSFWQSLGPAIVVGLIVLIRSKKISIDPKQIHFYIICGLTGILIPNTSMYYAASHLPASILAIVVNIVPVVVYPMALYVKLERFNWIRFMGICCAIIGLMLIILPKSSLPSPGMVPWVISTLITPISFAFCSIYIARNRPTNSDALTLSAGMLIASSILLMPLVANTHSMYWFKIPFTLPDWVILLEIILSSIGYVLFFKLISIAGPVFYCLVDTVVVLTGIFWGYIIFGEHLNRYTAAAVCFIVIALLLVTIQQTKSGLKKIER